MIKLKLVVIEDEFFAANHLSDLVDSLGHEVMGIYHSGEEFLAQTDWEFDAAIIDIFLSKAMTGLTVAHHLKEKQKSFVFLTANEDSRTLKEAAQLSPKAYISKPFKPNDVIATLEMIAHQHSHKIQIRSVHGTESLNVNEILFVKGDGAYVEIHTKGGRVITQRKLLKEMEVELPLEFTRVHRSYLVNQNKIENRATNYYIINGQKVPISRKYKKLD